MGDEGMMMPRCEIDGMVFWLSEYDKTPLQTMLFVSRASFGGRLGRVVLLCMCGLVGLSDCQGFMCLGLSDYALVLHLEPLLFFTYVA